MLVGVELATVGAELVIVSVELVFFYLSILLSIIYSSSNTIRQDAQFKAKDGHMCAGINQGVASSGFFCNNSRHVSYLSSYP